MTHVLYVIIISQISIDIPCKCLSHLLHSLVNYQTYNTPSGLYRSYRSDDECRYDMNLMVKVQHVQLSGLTFFCRCRSAPFPTRYLTILVCPFFVANITADQLFY